MRGTSRKQRKILNQGSLPVFEDKTTMDLYLEDVRSLGKHLLSRDEEVALGRRIQLGDVAAFLEMYIRNVRLVISVARKYVYQGSMVGLEYADLIQEGNIGLLTAIRKWDPELGFKFSTYGTWWIRQAIGRELANANLIRIPIHIHEDISKVTRAALDVIDSGGEEPSAEQLVELTGLTIDEVKLALEAIRNKQVPLSLDQPLDTEDGESSLLDAIANQYGSTDVGFHRAEIDTATIREILRKILTPRQLVAVELRFGFRSGRGVPLDTVGNALGVTRERARQILVQALEKLRTRSAYLHNLYISLYGTAEELDQQEQDQSKKARRFNQRLDRVLHLLEIQETIRDWESRLVEVTNEPSNNQTH